MCTIGALTVIVIFSSYCYSMDQKKYIDTEKGLSQTSKRQLVLDNEQILNDLLTQCSPRITRLNDYRKRLLKRNSEILARAEIKAHEKNKLVHCIQSLTMNYMLMEEEKKHLWRIIQEIKSWLEQHNFDYSLVSLSDKIQDIVRLKIKRIITEQRCKDEYEAQVQVLAKECADLQQMSAGYMKLIRYLDSVVNTPGDIV